MLVWLTARKGLLPSFYGALSHGSRSPSVSLSLVDVVTTSSVTVPMTALITGQYTYHFDGGSGKGEGGGHSFIALLEFSLDNVSMYTQLCMWLSV